uniref:Uncharacterized protein n=1 Tax=Candidatus Kentrum eta TaxID=2126337 RepID=A0A450V783_9GAMM|nr:MAG: hypothetical protein BECKH772A_GA0070896_100501 [Candidatus Kentron sp. H]VFJ93756.1 MAG: hypothetical protein BECKH772B_GA0070898_100501 [Candidatus Kentron sp. H]VFK00641.1 MAG: hypothetical protein BECKH772C_GA0070978_100501 [Candidatus Kentron sp. H]
MDFAKYMSVPWRGFGFCCALGYALIAVFLKNCYLTILDFSSSCLTQNNELKGSWSLYLNSFLSINLQSNKSQLRKICLVSKHNDERIELI